MKVFKIQATIVVLAAYAQAVVRETLTGVKRIMTHKIELKMNPSIKKLYDDSLVNPIYLRVDSTGKESRATFGVINSAGNLVLSLDSNAAQKIAETAGIDISLLPLYAQGCDFRVDFALREKGDTVVNTRSQEEVEIKITHIAPQNYQLFLTPESKMMITAANVFGSRLANNFGAIGASNSTPVNAGAEVEDNDSHDAPSGDDLLPDARPSVTEAATAETTKV